MEAGVEQFLSDRKAALLSMDEACIRAYARKYGAEIIQEAQGEVFWIMVHKARTGATDLSEEERQKSREWLAERGVSSLG